MQPCTAAAAALTRSGCRWARRADTAGTAGCGPRAPHSAGRCGQEGCGGQMGQPAAWPNAHCPPSRLPACPTRRPPVIYHCRLFPPYRPPTCTRGPPPLPPHPRCRSAPPSAPGTARCASAPTRTRARRLGSAPPARRASAGGQAGRARGRSGCGAAAACFDHLLAHRTAPHLLPGQHLGRLGVQVDPRLHHAPPRRLLDDGQRGAARAGPLTPQERQYLALDGLLRVAEVQV